MKISFISIGLTGSPFYPLYFIEKHRVHDFFYFTVLWTLLRIL